MIYDIEIKANNFENDYNRALFKTINFLAQEKDIDDLEFDPMTLITTAKKFSDVIGALKNQFNKEKELIKYIHTIQDFSVNPNNIDIYIEELLKANLVNRINRRNEHLKRKLINNFEQLNLEDIVDEIETNILEVTNDYTIEEDYEATKIGEGMMEEYLNREINTNGFVGYPMPFPKLNTFTGGLLRNKKGSVTIINAKTKVGKSIILKNTAKYIGIDLKKPVFWGSNEESPIDQKDKLLSEITGLDPNFIASGLYNKKGNEQLKQKVIEGIKKIEESNIFIEQIRGYDPQKLVKRARYYKKRYNIAVFIWDYVKRSSAYYGTEKALRHWLGDVVNTMKEEIADPLNLPVLTASQAKTFDSFLPAESQDIARHCTAFIVLRKLSQKEQNQNPVKGGKYGFTVKYN
ncbi:MAG: DnaB-like helicase C-terminal domain-containing protein, partial [Nanoarchaeota archaeon]